VFGEPLRSSQEESYSDTKRFSIHFRSFRIVSGVGVADCWFVLDEEELQG
jgi:hypothetical protein